MAADDWSQEHHLTPSGWVKGTYKFFRKVDGPEVPRPHDAVATYEERCRQSSIYSPESYTTTLLWADPDVSSADRIALRRKFRSPFTDEPSE